MDINSSRSSRTMKAERAHRQHVVLTHNPSSMEPGQTLQVRFPNLGENEVIAPGSFFISFALNLKGKKDESRSVVPNIGRKIIKTFKIYFEGNEVPERSAITMKSKRISTFGWLRRTKLGGFFKESTTPKL